MTNQVKIEDTFAEAFPMRGTRLIITAADAELVGIAAGEFCGNASSVIGCDAEVGIEGPVSSEDTVDGRPGISVLAFAFDRASLEKAVTARVGQNVLTCPTTACYAGLQSELRKDRIKVGSQLRFFGDGYQFSKKLEDRRFWRVPVMDGEFLCEDVVGTVKGIGGGNLLICGRSQRETLAAARSAVAAIRLLPDVIMPFSFRDCSQWFQGGVKIQAAEGKYQREMVSLLAWANRNRTSAGRAGRLRNRHRWFIRAGCRCSHGGRAQGGCSSIRRNANFRRKLWRKVRSSSFPSSSAGSRITARQLIFVLESLV